LRASAEARHRAHGDGGSEWNSQQSAPGIRQTVAARDLFQPRNDTQTSMVVLRRLSAAERANPPDYPIFMAVTDRIGHDKRGNPIYQRDLDGTDILVKREIKIKAVENGRVLEKLITELVPQVDDQLPLIPEAYHEWREEHGL
jgi:type I restriction enzyme M protein